MWNKKQVLFLSLGVILLSGILFATTQNEKVAVSRTVPNGLPKSIPLKIENEITKKSFPKELKPSEYVSWVKTNLQQELHSNNISYQLLYKPIDYEICQELRTDDIEQSVYKTFYSELEGNSYFLFKIKHDRHDEFFLEENDLSYEERVKYFSFNFQNDIKLVTSKGDSLSCGMYLFERNYGTSPYTSILFGFGIPDQELEKGFSIVMNDKMYQQNWNTFLYQKELVLNIPNLQLP